MLLYWTPSGFTKKMGTKELECEEIIPGSKYLKWKKFVENALLISFNSSIQSDNSSIILPI